MKLSAINELSRRAGFLFFLTIFGKHWDKAKPVGKFGTPLFPAPTGNIIKLLAHKISDGK